MTCVLAPKPPSLVSALPLTCQVMWDLVLACSSSRFLHLDKESCTEHALEAEREEGGWKEGKKRDLIGGLLGVFLEAWKGTLLPAGWLSWVDGRRDT